MASALVGFFERQKRIVLVSIVSINNPPRKIRLLSKILSFPFYWKYFTIFTGFFPYFLKERKNHALIVPAALWSSGLRRNPLKVESRVRFPAGSPITHNDIRKDVFCLYVLMVFLREVFFIHEKKDLFILR